MAAASKKNTTKENIEVRNNNKKNTESVFESNVKQKGRTGNTRKTGKSSATASKTANKNRKAVDVNITHQRKIQDVTEYRDRLAFETGITLIVIGIIAVFLYVSFLGLGGMVGRIFGGACFGIFGWVAWFIPLGMILAYIFTVVNKGDKRVPRKMTGIIGSFICLAAITDLVTKKEVITEYYTSNHVMHPAYFECMNLTLEDVLETGKSSGGLIGRWISSILSKICGNVGACILLFALLILCLFIFEGIEIMAALRKRNAYREEMERLYGEVRDEIGYREPSYTVLRNRSSINPFSNVKNSEPDIREKYKRSDRLSSKDSGKPDYVEAVRRNTNGVMQSVDLKMMGKFIDEQKKKNTQVREKDDVKDNEEIQVNKKKESEKKAPIKVKADSQKKIPPKKEESAEVSEAIPIFREEMDQKFGRNRGRAVYDTPNGVIKNTVTYAAETEIANVTDKEDSIETEIIDDKKVENIEDKEDIAVSPDIVEQNDTDNGLSDNVVSEENMYDIREDYDMYAENEKNHASDDSAYLENVEECNASDSLYPDKEEYDTADSLNPQVVEEYYAPTADDVIYAEDEESCQNTGYHKTETVQTTQYQPENVIDTPSASAGVGNVSYKKPENPDKHGKFGGDDYVSASASFNALNETKTAEPVIEQAYAFPPVELLGEPVHNNDSLSDNELRETANKLQETLKSFNVDVQMGAVTCGPTVTRYELLPEQGVRVNKITNLTDDIKLSLAAQSIRIEAPIPGKSAVGIEVPNPSPSSVFFRELLEGEAFEKAKSPLTFAVGKDISGKLILTDIGKMPHLLIAGATGSGKSVCINTLIMSILYKSDPKDVKLIMIDPKVVELSVYNGIPHLMCPVVTDAKDAAATLNWAVREMSDRYNKFTELGVRNIAGYNDKIKTVENPEKAGYTKMPYIVVIVDEFADLMMVASKDVEDAVCRLAQLARAAGIHLVLATQRPSVNVITGTIKANIPSRIAFSVSSAIDSRTILDRGGAEKLLGKGDMLFFPSGYSEPVRVQGAFVTDEEVSKVVDFLKDNNDKPEYNDKVTQVVEDEARETEKEQKPDRDEYFEEAGRFVIDSDRAAAGQLQRRFSIGFNRAGRIIDQLHKAGVVGPAEGTKPRKILMSRNEFEMMLGNAPEPVSDEEIDAITEEFGQQ